nr:protein IWS1 homolog isoform X1 [Ipomoea batatas]
MKGTLKTRHESDKMEAVATVAVNAGDVRLRASMTDATLVNGPSLNGIALAVEKPGSKKRFQFMRTVRVRDKPLNLNYIHFNGDNRTILDGTFVFDPSNKVSANHVLGSGNCKLKYTYVHKGLTTYEPIYDFAKDTWDFAISRRVYGDDVFKFLCQTSSKNLSLEWSRNSKLNGSFKALISIAQGSPMESDDDYEFSPSEEPSPVVQNRGFKRLKKPGRAPENPPVSSIDDLISLPEVDFAKLEALEASKTLEDSDDSEGPLSSSQGFDDDESELESGFEEKRNESRRVLNFDEEENGLNFNSEAPRSDGQNEEVEGDLELESPDDEILGKKGGESEGIGEGLEVLKVEKSGQKRNSGDLNLNESHKSKSKKIKNKEDNADDLMPKEPALNKRREQKERKQHLKELHVETQRLLRESRDATFKPIPVVHKPISSVLQKIRQRKLEVSKKCMALKNSSTVHRNNVLTEVMVDEDFDNEFVEDIIVEKSEEKAVAHEDLKSGEDGPSVSEVDAKPENVPSQMVLDEVAEPMFRAPVDTQDLFGDSQESDGTNERPKFNASSPLEEVMAPSVLAMNLKFDSVPPDECSSDEEDNHKENIDPHLHSAREECPPKGDPVKAFVDEEAEEEDDSDNDLHRFSENEDEDIEDSEELKDIIATNYEERPMDNERRNELHRKWLEQQDADGTENLLKKLKFNSKHRETTLLDDEQVDSECEEFNDDAGEEAQPKNPVQVNKRKAKQIITQMFIDKDDVFLSDDEEETEKRRVKQHVLVRAEERTALVPPTEDESSRQVFGLIKKLNVVPDQKKKAKPLSFFDNMVGGAKDNSSLKSSFLGRASKHHLPVSHKKSSSLVRSFIFERDDSNSRNSISMSEDSSHTIMKQNHPTRNNAARFSSSQTKSSTQSKSSGAETSSGVSLFEILKQSSTPSCSGDQKHEIDFSQALHAAFKIPKKPFLEDLRLN